MNSILISLIYKLKMFPCQQCNRSFTRKDNLARHQKTACLRRKKSFRGKGDEPPQKLARLDNQCMGQTSTSKEDCYICSTSHLKKDFLPHLQSADHEGRARERGIEKTTDGFGGNVSCYKIETNGNHNLTIGESLSNVKGIFKDLIKTQIGKLTTIKMKISVFVKFVAQMRKRHETRRFHSEVSTATASTDLEELYQAMSDVIETKSTTDFYASGWSILQVSHVEVNVYKYNPLAASGFLETPEDIKLKKAVLNIQSNDDQCFKWCILAGTSEAPIPNPNRVISYKNSKHSLTFRGISFPVKLTDIPKFEALNNISVNVYGLRSIASKSEIIGPLHYTSRKRNKHVNLLLLTDSNNSKNGHYCLIKNMSRLFSSQLSKHGHAKFICDGCLNYFNEENKFDTHRENGCNRTRIILPTDKFRKNKYGEDTVDNVREFINYEKKLTPPFCIFVDFFTDSFAYKIKCTFDDSFKVDRAYTGVKMTKVFFKRLQTDIKNIYVQYLKDAKPLPTLTQDEKSDFDSATHCHICEKPFQNEKVRDHCHLTGKFRGAAHPICNLHFRVSKSIPVFINNLPDHVNKLIKETKSKDNLRVQIKNDEISMAKNVWVGEIDQRNSYVLLNFLNLSKFSAESIDINRSLNLARRVEALSNDFETFQYLCLSNYKLDPAHYTSKTSYVWDAMLKFTKIKLELLTEIDMLHFFEKDLPFGTSFYKQAVVRANNEFTPKYDTTQPTSYIVNFHVKNLYQTAMSQFIPYSCFQWVEPSKFDRDVILRLDDDFCKGYIFEVDLKFESLDLCKILSDKSHCTIHYRNLKRLLLDGVKLIKIHSVLEFRQKDWLKNFVQHNETKNKRFSEFVTQAIIKKSMDNQVKSRTTLIDIWKNKTKRIGAQAMIAKSTFKRCSMVSKNLALIQLQKSPVLYDSPVYIAYAMSEISKSILYDLYKCFKDKCDHFELICVDNDRFVAKIRSDNFNGSFKAIEFPHNEFIVDGIKLSDYSEDVIYEFHGTEPKNYLMKTVSKIFKGGKIQE